MLLNFNKFQNLTKLFWQLLVQVLNLSNLLETNASCNSEIKLPFSSNVQKCEIYSDNKNSKHVARRGAINLFELQVPTAVS